MWLYGLFPKSYNQKIQQKLHRNLWFSLQLGLIKISPTPKPVFSTPAPQSKILGATLLPGGNPLKYPLRLAVQETTIRTLLFQHNYDLIKEISCNIL